MSRARHRALAAALALLAFMGAASLAAASPPLTLEAAVAAASEGDSGGAYPSRILGSGAPLDLMSPRAAARVRVMAAYFDALLADYDAGSLDEHMATAFGRVRQAEREQPGSLDALRAELRYRELQAQRNAARVQQRLTRERLAMLMGGQAAPRAELADPELAFAGEAAAGFGGLLEEAFRANPVLRSAGGATSARVRRDLSVALTALVLERDWLQDAERQRARVAGKLADRVLEVERARFERGEPAAFGEALAASVEARREERRVEYRLALAIACIDGLIGRPVR